MWKKVKGEIGFLLLRELLPALLADGDIDLKFLAANQHELGQNLCWALKLKLVISFSPRACNEVSQPHVLPMMTFWLHTVVCRCRADTSNQRITQNKTLAAFAGLILPGFRGVRSSKSKWGTLTSGDLAEISHRKQI